MQVWHGHQWFAVAAELTTQQRLLIDAHAMLALCAQHIMIRNMRGLHPSKQACLFVTMCAMR